MKKLWCLRIMLAVMLTLSFSVVKAEVVEVNIQDFFFEPQTVTISVGDEVKWTNLGDAPHTSTSGEPGAPDGIWDSGVLNTGDTFSRQFMNAGSFPYYCTIHPTMEGTVIVEEAPPAEDVVIINEIFYDPEGADNQDGNEDSYEWVELKNVSDSPQNISDWEIRAETYYSLSALIASVPINGFVLIFQGTGTDSNVDFGNGNVANLYMNKTGSQLGNSSGDVALYNSTTNNENTIVDYMAYGAPSDTTNHNHAVDAGIWTSGDFASDIDSGHSLEYDGTGNTGTAWFDQAFPTPGEENTLPVEMSSFTAKLTSDGVLLEWRTESETNNAGFNLYRRKEGNGELVKVNDKLIEGAGTTTTPQKYSYLDEKAEKDSIYIIETVAFDGETSQSEAEVIPKLNPKRETIFWGELKNID